MGQHGTDIGWRHVGGHRLEAHFLTFEPSPERLQGLGAFAVADEDHGPAFQVQDHRQVAVPFADGDFVDGDLLELVQLGRAKRRCRCRFWISLMMSQLTPKCRATSLMVMCRDSSRA